MEKRGFLPALTSIRFFAAFAIVLLHAEGYFGIPKRYFRELGAFQAVSLFFVLSGFVMYYCHQKLEGQTARNGFYISRWARLWPLHFLTFLAAAALVPTESLWSSQALANLSLVQAWIPLNRYSASFNSVSWSISTEFFFYLAFPFLVYRWEERWLKWLVASLFVVMIAIWLVPWLGLQSLQDNPDGMNVPAVMQRSPLIRIFEFLLGMATARYFLSRDRSTEYDSRRWTIFEISAAILLLATAQLTTALRPFAQPALGLGAGAWVYHSGSCLMSALAIFVFAHQRGSLTRLLSLRPFVVLGEISFALYMLHNIYFMRFEKKDHPLLVVPEVLQLPTFLLGSCALSYVVWRFFERPARRAVVGKAIV